MQVFAHIHDFKIIIHFKPDSVLEFYGGSTMVLQWFYSGPYSGSTVVLQWFYSGPIQWFYDGSTMVLQYFLTIPISCHSLVEVICKVFLN